MNCNIKKGLEDGLGVRWGEVHWVGVYAGDGGGGVDSAQAAEIPTGFPSWISRTSDHTPQAKFSTSARTELD